MKLNLFSNCAVRVMLVLAAVEPNMEEEEIGVLTEMLARKVCKPGYSASTHRVPKVLILSLVARPLLKLAIAFTSGYLAHDIFIARTG